MYDSDEVRDTVRQDAADFYMRRSLLLLVGEPVASLTAFDEAAIDDTLTAAGNPWQAAISEYLDRQEAQRRIWADLYAAFRELAQAAAIEIKSYIEAFFGGLFEPVRRAAEAMRELAESIGIVAAPEPPPFAWQRRERRPHVQPAHVVDAVAAGRHPAMSLRTRLRGGRR